MTRYQKIAQYVWEGNTLETKTGLHLIFSCPLDELNWRRNQNRRHIAYLALDCAGVRIVGQLVMLTKGELRRMARMGPDGRSLIKDLLAELELRIGMTPERIASWAPSPELQASPRFIELMQKAALA